MARLFFRMELCSTGKNGVSPTKRHHIPYAFLIHSTSGERSPCRMECCVLNTDMEDRARRLAEYVIENKGTVRAAARQFGISKSTVHKDLQERLPAHNPTLYRQVRVILDENKAERHIRGGLATRKKYKGI